MINNMAKKLNISWLFCVGLIFFSSFLLSTNAQEGTGAVVNNSIVENFKTEFEQMCPGNWRYQTTDEGFIKGVSPADENSKCLIKTKPSLFIDKFLEQFSASFGIQKNELIFSYASNLKRFSLFEYKRQLNNIDVVNSFINFKFYPPLTSEGEASAVIGEQQDEKTTDIYLTGVSSRLYPDIGEKFETIPKISEEQLKQIIEKEEKGTGSYNFKNEGLFILPKAFVTEITTPKLAYKASVTKPNTLYSFTYYIDAVSGEVLSRFSDVRSGSPAPTTESPQEKTPLTQTPVSTKEPSKLPMKSFNYFWAITVLSLLVISILVVFYIYKRRKSNL